MVFFVSFGHSLGYRGYGGTTYCFIWAMIIAADYRKVIADRLASGVSEREIGQKLADTLFG